MDIAMDPALAFHLRIPGRHPFWHFSMHSHSSWTWEWATKMAECRTTQAYISAVLFPPFQGSSCKTSLSLRDLCVPINPGTSQCGKAPKNLMWLLCLTCPPAKIYLQPYPSDSWVSLALNSRHKDRQGNYRDIGRVCYSEEVLRIV